MQNHLKSADRKKLQKAFKQQRLTLYLGAGVSAGSGLPTWDKLVLALYFATVSEQKMGNWRPFPNYLYAISEWYLSNRGEPLEITARKLRALYKDNELNQDSFQNAVRDALYGIETDRLGDMAPPPIDSNATLMAVRNLCCAKYNGDHGIRSVVTYNYDDLLERALKKKRKTASVFGNISPATNELPIFHVHGFIPFPTGGNQMSGGMVFSEDEYNQAAIDPYSWSNIVQLREMSNSLGIMIGLSLDDRNIRRLLDALSQSPVKPQIYALMSRPKKATPTGDDVNQIDDAARKLLHTMEEAQIKSRAMGSKSKGYMRGPHMKEKQRYAHEIKGIISAVDDIDELQHLKVMESLGITPIWYDNYAEIPCILKEISRI